MRRSILLSVLLMMGAAAACSSYSKGPKGCKARAKAQYDWCINPHTFAEGEQHKMTNSQEAQKCQQEYRQALSLCGEGPDVELPPIGTSSTSTTVN